MTGLKWLQYQSLPVSFCPCFKENSAGYRLFTGGQAKTAGAHALGQAGRFGGQVFSLGKGHDSAVGTVNFMKLERDNIADIAVFRRLFPLGASVYGTLPETGAGQGGG